jgi:protein-disulfide isomerase
MRKPLFVSSGSRFLIGIAAIVLLGIAGWWVTRHQTPHDPTATATTIEAPAPAGPPWIYGRPDARITVIEYADLECPFCRDYFPVLKRWIDAHPEVNWQWHHLPLAMHEPVASTEARLVECVGTAEGQVAFWRAAEWIYTHTRSDGQGLPEGLRYPGLTSAVQQCLDSDHSGALIREQSAIALREGIDATPTLRLRDRQSGKTLLLHGPVEGDALLSAIDLLMAAPADEDGDRPR